MGAHTSVTCARIGTLRLPRSLDVSDRVNEFLSFKRKIAGVARMRCFMLVPPVSASDSQIRLHEDQKSE